MTSAHLESGLPLGEGEQVHSAGTVSLQRQRLHHKIIRLLGFLYVNKFVNVITNTEDVWVSVLAQLALKTPPEIGVDIALLARLNFQV